MDARSLPHRRRSVPKVMAHFHGAPGKWTGTAPGGNFVLRYCGPAEGRKKTAGRGGSPFRWFRAGVVGQDNAGHTSRRRR